MSENKKIIEYTNNPFMSDHDPKNPYGPNYEPLPYETKLYYKFCKIAKFVHYSPED
jgi:hypothetical protein